jgi:hypothetical protein
MIKENTKLTLENKKEINSINTTLILRSKGIDILKSEVCTRLKF